MSPLVLAFLLTAPAAGDVSVQILSATTKDKVVAGATLFFQKEGQNSKTTTTDASGKATLAGLDADDASVSLIVKKDGFSPLVVKCPCNGMSYAVSEALASVDSFRVVLNWGAMPRDLDLHAIYKGNHVFFQQKQGTDAFLDVDDTDGFGPETITVKQRHQGEKYVFAVHNYSASSGYGTKDLSNSKAKVFVYVGSSLVRSYYVRPNQVGTLWVLFGVDDNGAFHDVNQLIDVPEPPKVVHYMKQMTERGDFGVTMRTSTADVAAAATLAKKADDLVAANKLDEAIEAYQHAIDLNPNSAATCSSLAKAFEKAGRKAEAEWAAKKAAATSAAPTNGYRVPNDEISFEASSTLPNWRQYDFVASNLVDDNLWTSWQPATKPAGGVGEWVKMTFKSPKNITAFEFSNGFRRTDDFGDLYKKNNRIKTAAVECSDGTSVPINFEDKPTELVIPLPAPKTCAWVKLTVKAVFKGKPYNDLAVSEMHPLTKD